MGQYAGQTMTTGAQAKVYADNFIAFHLSKMGGTYSALSGGGGPAQADHPPEGHRLTDAAQAATRESSHKNGRPLPPGRGRPFAFRRPS
jgi:hypothetical protein